MIRKYIQMQKKLMFIPFVNFMNLVYYYPKVERTINIPFSKRIKAKLFIVVCIVAFALFQFEVVDDLNVVQRIKGMLSFVITWIMGIVISAILLKIQIVSGEDE